MKKDKTPGSGSDPADEVRRAYSILAAIRKNFDFWGSMSESIVNEYHGALDHLAAAGYDVEEFRIPGGALKPEVISVSMRRGGRTQYGKPVVRGSLFVIKLDAVLGYFLEAEGSTAPREIGFHGPREE